jgi:hypothetical protein
VTDEICSCCWLLKQPGRTLMGLDFGFKMHILNDHVCPVFL